jgi:hypothetical protein
MSLGDCFVNHGNIDCIEIVKLQGTVNHSGILRLPLSSCAPPKLHNVLPAVDVKRCHGTSCGAGHSSYSINWIYRFAYMIYHDISTYVSYIYIYLFIYIIYVIVNNIIKQQPQASRLTGLVTAARPIIFTSPCQRGADLGGDAFGCWVSSQTSWDITF